MMKVCRSFFTPRNVSDACCKRSMDAVGGPDAKKARWSPTSINAPNGLSSGNTSAARDAFANYGYGPQASISQSAFNNPPPSAGFNGNPLYSTPSLNANHSPNGNNMAQLSPNTAAAFAQQQQQQQQQQQVNGNGNAYSGFGYNMLGMGLPGMNMLGAFPYTGQMGNFGQVGVNFLLLLWPVLIFQVQRATEFPPAATPTVS